MSLSGRRCYHDGIVPEETSHDRFRTERSNHFPIEIQICGTNSTEIYMTPGHSKKDHDLRFPFIVLTLTVNSTCSFMGPLPPPPPRALLAAIVNRDEEEDKRWC